MAIRKGLLKATGVALVLVLAGCAGQKPTTKQAQPPSTFDESFDVSSLGVEEIPLPNSSHRPGQASGSLRSPSSQDTTKTGEQQLILGYRVQICATTDEQEARSYLHEALLKFPDQGVYLTFDSPYYKVRVGDCKSRFEAEELQKLVQKNGFPDAWVVRTRVYANPEVGKQNSTQQSPAPNN